MTGAIGQLDPMSAGALLVVTLTAWIGLRVLSGRARGSIAVRAGMFLLRALAAFACLLAAMHLSARAAVLATSWPLWAIALAGGVAVEASLALQAPDRRSAGPGAGAAMAGIRAALVLLVVAMLAQPVLSWELVEDVDRRVAVLVDTSASMSVRDERPAEAEDDGSRLGRTVTLLLGRDGRPGLLGRLQESHKVALYEFAGRCAPTDAASLAAAAEAEALTIGPSSSGPSAGEHDPAGLAGDATDLAGAVAKVREDLSGGRLAGVVLLTDGRHNGGAAVEPMAAELGLARTPIFAVRVAATQPPRDAAVLDVDAPQTVMAGDRLLVRAQLKLDGLAGRTVEVSLADGSRRVDSRKLTVPRNRSTWRPRVLLTDTPALGAPDGDGESLIGYRLRIAPQAGEAFIDNNTRPLTVRVTRRRTRMLLIDNRPRWEFRYLRNLFDGRDPSVRLQYVLLRPDAVAGAPPGPDRPASATRPPGESEATAPPASAEEWMKFDVIVLGDISPADLEPEQIDAMRRFVTGRGGTLVVVAGPTAMPHAWARTPLADILPVRILPGGDPGVEGLTGGASLALTAEGREHPVMFQDAEPEKNDAAWSAVPPIYWRHPHVEARPGATVLAYAAQQGGPGRANGPAARRRAIERDYPLIVLHRAEAGRVLAVCFDATWRLRYRTGDARHHRFWGQLVRWATDRRLAGGTDHVQFGTDRTRYEPGQAVRVRARIVADTLALPANTNVSASLYRGGTLRMTRRMEPQPGSRGEYEASLGALDGGAYRVELDAPDVAPILAADGAAGAFAEFAVDDVAPDEKLELSANAALLGRLAALSGGEVLAEADAAQHLGDVFGPARLTTRQRREIRLWDSWPLLTLIIALACTDWVLRKRNALC